jgi:hypothetical protein
LVGVHGVRLVGVDALKDLFFQAPETTVPAFAGTVFIIIYSEELTSSWQPSSCRLSSSQTSLLSLP